MATNNIRCKSYTGLACVDGTCPIANQEKHEEYAMPVKYNCNECFYYKGCEDCYFQGTEECEKAKV